MGQVRAGEVVISIGLETSLYKALSQEDYGIKQILIDVRPYIDSPPKHDRVPFDFPHPVLIKQVKENPGFAAAVAASAATLNQYGIVLIGCRAGRHRAPTVAEDFKHPHRHVIHTTKERHNLRDLLILFQHCYYEAADRIISQSLRRYPAANLCVGWACRSFVCRNGVEFCALRFGQQIRKLRIETVDGTGFVCFDEDSQVEHRILLCFLLPRAICLLHPGFAKADVLD